MYSRWKFVFSNFYLIEIPKYPQNHAFSDFGERIFCQKHTCEKIFKPYSCAFQTKRIFEVFTPLWVWVASIYSILLCGLFLCHWYTPKLYPKNTTSNLPINSILDFWKLSVLHQSLAYLWIYCICWMSWKSNIPKFDYCLDMNVNTKPILGTYASGIGKVKLKS